MDNPIKSIAFRAGEFEVIDESGSATVYPIADMLRAADIPVGLTYAQVSAITALANLNVILIRTLIEKGVLDESFLEEGDLNLDDINEAIVNMGGDFGDPDLSGSET